MKFRINSGIVSNFKKANNINDTIIKKYWIQREPFLPNFLISIKDPDIQ